MNPEDEIHYLREQLKQMEEAIKDFQTQKTEAGAIVRDYIFVLQFYANADKEALIQDHGYRAQRVLEAHKG